MENKKKRLFKIKFLEVLSDKKEEEKKLNLLNGAKHSLSTHESALWNHKRLNPIQSKRRRRRRRWWRSRIYVKKKENFSFHHGMSTVISFPYNFILSTINRPYARYTLVSGQVYSKRNTKDEKYLIFERCKKSLIVFIRFEPLWRGWDSLFYHWDMCSSRPKGPP